jgi:hypothetical protein
MEEMVIKMKIRNAANSSNAGLLLFIARGGAS